MARSVIILLASILVMGNSCQTAEERMAAAAKAQGEVQAKIARPVTPDSCIAKVERVKPKVGEKARWTQKRWEIVADNRDRLADDCRETLDGYWNEIEKVGVQ
jgi:cytochrome c5